MKIRNLVVGMLFLFILADFSGWVEASRHKFTPDEKESAALAPAKEKGVMLMNRIGPSASELYIANADGTNERTLLTDSAFDYHASYSSDGKWIVFTSERSGDGQADLYRVHPDATGLERLTDSPAVDDQGALSPDGTKLAFVSSRNTYQANIWILDLKTRRLRIMNLADRSVRVLTTEYDNVPYWLSTDERIVFTRKANDNFDIFTIRPDGSELRRLTTALANDGHAVWTGNGKYILWSSGQTGWKDEAAHYDNTFQPYAAIFMMKADGTEKRQLTDSLWEDAMPCFVPKAERTR